MPQKLPPLTYPREGEAAFRRALDEQAAAYLAARGDYRFADGRRLVKALVLGRQPEAAC